VEPDKHTVGQHLRIFTHAEEQVLAEFLRTEVLIPGYVLQESHFHIHAITAWSEKFGHRGNIRKFNCSNGHMNDFKRRHRFTSRVFHYKRRG
jgi:hypothetical protein